MLLWNPAVCRVADNTPATCPSPLSPWPIHKNEGKYPDKTGTNIIPPPLSLQSLHVPQHKRQIAGGPATLAVSFSGLDSAVPPSKARSDTSNRTQAIKFNITQVREEGLGKITAPGQLPKLPQTGHIQMGPDRHDCPSRSSLHTSHLANVVVS
ncbi:hypothetical protein H920_10637 [Fukomys damarensis]|uniref:Uncharacterized protein n=1 Tax=Fukomys damarensis TaxID=885580 RepID=A0A091DYP5_FUKDA|nr:hypothetical protein H920_10637 [Fukomys damarensis]